MSIFRSKELPGDKAHRVALLKQARFEVIPLKNLAAQLPFLPAASEVSVTASPAKSLEDTWSLSRELSKMGMKPIPHLAARMITGQDQLRMLIDQLPDIGASELFLVGGDAPEPFGPFNDSIQVLEVILGMKHELTHIGVTAYPDGHSFIDSEVLSESLHKKEALLKGSGVEGHAATQMCFDPRTIRTWLSEERKRGLSLPIHLGVPGAVERTKLLSIGARLGVGASLRFLKKNRATLARMFAPGGYDPDKLLRPVNPELQSLGVEGLHVFTFNQVQSTVTWRDEAIAGS